MKKNVGSYSTHKVACVNRLDSMAHAHHLMQKISTRHLPVLDQNGLVIGMISDRDVLRAMKKPLDSDWHAVPAVPEFDSDKIVQEYMSWPIGTIEESASLSDVAKIMLERKISALVVTKNERFTGIVTTDDLLRVLIEDQKKTPGELKDQIYGAIYRSPIGSIMQSLSNSGI